MIEIALAILIAEPGVLYMEEVANHWKSTGKFSLRPWA